MMDSRSTTSPSLQRRSHRPSLRATFTPLSNALSAKNSQICKKKKYEKFHLASDHALFIWLIQFFPRNMFISISSEHNFHSRTPFLLLPFRFSICALPNHVFCLFCEVS